MRKMTVFGLAAVLALSAVLTGTILAQEEDTAAQATAWLGISFSETSDGVMVRRVTTGSPAAAGGLLIGDLFVSIDGAAIESADGLVEIVAAHAPGDVIELVVLRNGVERTLEVELGSTASTVMPGAGFRSPFAAGDADPLVMAERVLCVDLDAVDGGYQVLAGGMRMTTDLEAGDVIAAVNGTPVGEVNWPALLTELAASDDDTLTLTVLRDGEELTLESTPFAGFAHGFSQPGMMDRFGGGRHPGMMDRFGGFGRDGGRGRGGFPGGMPHMAPGMAPGAGAWGTSTSMPTESSTPA